MRAEQFMAICWRKRIKAILLLLFMPRGYNMPDNWRMLFNQWLHQGYLWKWWSKEFHDKHLKEVF